MKLSHNICVAELERTSRIDKSGYIAVRPPVCLIVNSTWKMHDVRGIITVHRDGVSVHVHTMPRSQCHLECGLAVSQDPYTSRDYNTAQQRGVYCANRSDGGP